MEKDEKIITLLLGQWEKTIGSVTSQVNSLQWASNLPVAPGSNTVNYIVGHLVVFQDKIIEAIDIGDRFFADLDHLYIPAYKKTELYPPYEELLEKWMVVNEFLKAKVRTLSTDQWLSRHNYVTEEEFALEPERNKLAVFMSRYYHLCSHMGQVRMVKGKE